MNQRYDLVLSGINYGVNLGADIVYSGTVGAIFEAARMKMPAIAFSSFPDEQEAAAERLTEAYEYITKNNLFAECLPFNVNIPKNAKAIRMTYQGSPFFSDEFKKLDEGDLYMQMGEPIPDAEPNDLDRDTVAVRNLKNALQRLRREMGMPQTLKEAGIDPRQVWHRAPEVVKATLADPCCKTNPFPVEDFTVRRILEEVTGRV